MAGGRGASEQVEGPRVRAWVLVKSTNPAQTAGDIGAEYTKGFDNYVIVRADVVTGADMDVIVPVDVANEAALETVLDIIREAPGFTSLSVARVTSYNPAPPQQSHLFVTEAELNADPPSRVDFPRAGRHPQSPGRNGWG